MEKDKDNILNGRFALHLAAIIIAVLFLVRAVLTYFPETDSYPPRTAADTGKPAGVLTWQKPDMDSLGDTGEDKLIRYGHDLIANTAVYLGPHGSVRHITNGMNCQNCHLEAGTKIWGNNYSAVASSYPKFRARSGSTESIYRRVNDCIERSLNGSPLDTSGREMQAIRAYIIWLGRDIPHGKSVSGAGITSLSYMNRAADTAAGRAIYALRCASCHSADGGGIMNPDGRSYQYPPLWGPNSYTIGAGLYRLSRLAGYVVSNMPFGTSYTSPVLTGAEAWDVAAFVNSQPRPRYDLSHDWPQISSKPVDHPFGPYTDTFGESRHKYGPWGEMARAK